MSRFDEAEDPRRRLLIKALATGAFSLAVPDQKAFAAFFFGSVPKKLPAEKSFFSIKGTVLVNGQEANLTTLVKPNDTVETRKRSEAVFVVGGNSMILRENSHMKMEGKVEKSSPFILGIRLFTGKLLSVSRSQGTQIRSSTATIGIRGTGFYIESEPDRTYFCTCYGLTDAEANDDPASKETVASKHHDRPLYILAGEPEGKNIRYAPFIDHTDQELMLIEALVGRAPPFVFTGEEYSSPRREY